MPRYVDVDKAVEEARLDYCKNCDSYNGLMCIRCPFDDAMDFFEGVPTADVVEVRHGEWIYDPNGMDWDLGAWLCSECRVKNDNLGGSKNINPYLFAGSSWCPHCGAKMDLKTRIIGEKKGDPK